MNLCWRNSATAIIGACLLLGCVESDADQIAEEIEDTIVPPYGSESLQPSSPKGQQTFSFDGEVFGASRNLTCTWFTNFENSRFEQCYDATSKLLEDGDGASVKCVGDTCSRLDAAARKAAKWRNPEPPSGSFTVRLVGRISMYPHKKRYLGDATRTVLVQKLFSVDASE